MITPIKDVFTAHPLCEEILRFLARNASAMDTAGGIAAWWVHSDEVAVQGALDRLMACGLVTPHVLGSRILYALTRNPEIRTWLRATYGATSEGDVRSPDVGQRVAADG